MQGPAENPVLTVVRQEVKALARLYDGYDEALFKLGLIRRGDGEFSAVGIPVSPTPPTSQANAAQFNVFGWLGR